MTDATDSAGASHNDDNTNINQPEFNLGAVPADAVKVQLLVDGQVVDATVRIVNGQTLITPTTVLTDGPHNISYKFVDATGNISAESPALAIVIDTMPPATPVLVPDMTDATDSAGASHSDDNTYVNKPNFNLGNLPADVSEVQLLVDGQLVNASVSVDNNGNSIITPTTALTDGHHDISYKYVDTAGNVSGESPKLSIVIDTGLPSVLSAAIDVASDSGAAGDGITNDTTPTISGAGATPGDLITVVMPGTGEKLTVTVASDGSWSVTPLQAIPFGTVGNAIVTATDLAGNVSAPAAVPLSIISDLNIVGSVTAGPMTAGITILAYDNQGNLLGSTELDANGHYSIVVANRGNYTGAVLVRAEDTNGSTANYLDEVAAINKSLDTSLRALSNLS
jgi:hypothetical protein